MTAGNCHESGTMNEWYYARGGKQTGPVAQEVLVGLAKSGGLDPINDLVWTSTMKDWLPAGQVPGIFTVTAPSVMPPADPSNPYAAPVSDWTEPVPSHAGDVPLEIEPGSQPIRSTACIKRSFDLVMRNFGMILLVGIVYIVTLGVSGVVFNTLDSALGLPPADRVEHNIPQGEIKTNFYIGASQNNPNASYLNILLSNVFSSFLSLGLTRIGLNLVTGKEISIAMLFGGGRKLLTACVATILYFLMVAIGFLLLIFPGIYLALKYGQYLTAIVDKDLGIIDSLKYSGEITRNNKMNLFALWLLMILVVLAGALALLIGLAVALPVVWLSWIVAYRWMQYGYVSALDHPGSRTPMLSGIS